MFRKSSIVIFLFVAAINSCIQIPDFESYCTLISPVITILPEFEVADGELAPPPLVTLDFDLEKEYKKEEAKIIGQGTSGKVVPLVLPFENPMKVAVKKIKVTGSTPEELHLTRLMGRAKMGPRLISCQHDPTNLWPITMYIVLSMGHFDLDSQDARKALKKLEAPERVQVYKKMLSAVRVLWSLGFIHNDIKPANFVADEKLNLIWLIDYGSVSQITEPLPTNGSPPFMSPGKFTNAAVSPVHDLYSWAMSVAYLESDISKLQDSTLLNDDDSYWKFVGLKGKLPQTCFVQERTSACRSKLVTNAIKILTERGFGPYIEWKTIKSQNYRINLTTLIGEIIWFDGFSATHEEVEGYLGYIMTELQNAMFEAQQKEQVKKGSLVI